jgi:hypothetical protein
MIPDLVRTVGNVTMDVAATTAIARMGLAHDAAELGANEFEAGESVAAPRPALATAGAQEIEGAKP